MKDATDSAEGIIDKAVRALNRLARWRTVFASWQLGTRSDTDGECEAVKDHREATMLLRAEVSALVALLMNKGLFTRVDFTEQLGKEAELLMRAYEKHFPGFRTDDDGVVLDVPVANETIKKLHFPP